MSKIDKKELTRGTKLTKEHVWDNNLDAVITNVNSANTSGADGLIQPQYETGNGTFTVTWIIPKITSRWTRTNGPNRDIIDVTTATPTISVGQDGAAPWIIPFVLPPFQEFLSFTGGSDASTPQIYLSEFSFGFDQRGEPALPTDDTCGPGVDPVPTGVAASTKTWGQYIRLNSTFASVEDDHHAWVTNKNHGKLHYNIETRGPLKFEILGKDSLYFNPNAGQSLTDKIYKLEIPMAGFIGRDLRINPGFESDLDIFMDPYKTYALAITPPQLHDPDKSASSTANNLALVNLTIKMKFKTKLVNRDVTGVDTIIAQPSEHGGSKTPNTIAVNKPVANGTITADDTRGLNTTTTTIDQVFKDKLRSGYDELSQPPPIEELCQDSGYDIIAIPLWNNQSSNIVTVRDGVMAKSLYHPGGWDTAGNLNISDTDGPMTRAIVPIDFPFTIHHAFLSANVYTANFQINGDSSIGGGASDPLNREMCWDAWDLADNQYPAPASETVALGQSDAQPYTDIGVGVGTGLRATQYGYRQVLNYSGLKLNDPNSVPYKFDEINIKYPWQLNYPTSPNHIIYNLPLNGKAGAGAGVGAGLFDTAGTKVGSLAQQLVAQDPPHFCGQSWLARNKTTPGTHPMTSASTTGTTKRYIGPTGSNTEIAHDQWLEVRWKTTMKTAAGADVGWSTISEYGSAAGGLADADDSKIIHGVGGHWLYLVVKKTVVSTASLQNTNLKGGM